MHYLPTHCRYRQRVCRGIISDSHHYLWMGSRSGGSIPYLLRLQSQSLSSLNFLPLMKARFFSWKKDFAIAKIFCNFGEIYFLNDDAKGSIFVVGDYGAGGV